MKRLLVLVVVLAPWSLFIAGCGGTGGSSGADSGKPTETQQQEMKEKMQEKMKSGKMGK
jgi:predicted small lipoprotein YifL